MSVTVTVPTVLRTLTGGEKKVSADGATVGEIVADLEAKFPGIRDRLLDESGTLRRFVNVFVDDDDVRFLQGLDTPVPDGGTVSVLQAVAGGS